MHVHMLAQCALWVLATHVNLPVVVSVKAQALEWMTVELKS
jgi:hypothetical protein